MALLAGTGLLLWFGQPAGAVLLPLTGLLLAALVRRDRRARALARRIAAGRLDEKIEVRPGALGDLDRAVNGLLQARRIQQRLGSVMPSPLPSEAMQALLGGNLPTHGELRMVAILLASCGPRTGQRDRGQSSAVGAWRALALAGQDLAQRHSALLQPCGDAIMLVFGTFADQPVGESLRAALSVGEELRRSWRAGADGPLVISLAIGSAIAAALPGLGYCVLGAPVGEAIQIQQLALQSGQYGVLCGEGVYYALRQAPASEWQPTELRIPAAQRRAQVVYSRADKERLGNR
jgi:class 3 adenylate cyclase